MPGCALEYIVYSDTAAMRAQLRSTALLLAALLAALLPLMGAVIAFLYRKVNPVSYTHLEHAHQYLDAVSERDKRAVFPLCQLHRGGRPHRAGLDVYKRQSPSVAMPMSQPCSST